MHKSYKLKKTGRIIFAIPFIIFGAMHLIAGSQMAGMVPSMFPGSGALWVYLSGIILIAGGLTVAVNKHAKEGALGLAVLMLIFILTIHIPGMSNPEMQQIAMVSLLKDAALLGAALTYAGLASHCCCWKGECKDGACKDNTCTDGKCDKCPDGNCNC